MNHMENKDLYSVKMRASRAMLLNADTLERLEPDVTRGIRATFMDSADDNDNRMGKNHFKEALVLATKVANQKKVGECIRYLEQQKILVRIQEGTDE